MKRCSRCGERKLAEHFHRWHRDDGRQPWCKPCRKAYDAEYHQKYKERRRSQRREAKATFLAWYRELKESLACSDCGGRFHHAAMQFDHLPGTEKRGDVGHLMRYSSKTVVLAEMEKCEPVCANCHAVRTFERGIGLSRRAAADRNRQSAGARRSGGA